MIDRRSQSKGEEESVDVLRNLGMKNIESLYDAAQILLDFGIETRISQKPKYFGIEEFDPNKKISKERAIWILGTTKGTLKFMLNKYPGLREEDGVNSGKLLTHVMKTRKKTGKERVKGVLYRMGLCKEEESIYEIARDVRERFDMEFDGLRTDITIPGTKVDYLDSEVTIEEMGVYFAIRKRQFDNACAQKRVERTGIGKSRIREITEWIANRKQVAEKENLEILNKIYQTEFEDMELMLDHLKTEYEFDPKPEGYLNEEIDVKTMLGMGLTNSEILYALGKESSLMKTGETETNRRFLTNYLVMDFVTDDEERRFELISELYAKDLKEGSLDDEEVEVDIIDAIRTINEKYDFNFPLPEIEEPEPEAEPEKFDLKDVQEMLGNDTVFEHLLKYLDFKIGEGQISKDGLTRYTILSDCDDFSLEDRQEFLAEIDVEGNIIELSNRLSLTPYMPSPKINENNMPEVVGAEPDVYKLEHIREMLEPGVFEHFKAMLGHKENFTIKDLAIFAVESECGIFYLDDRNYFLEDIGIEGDIYDTAKIFGLTPYTPKEPGEHEEEVPALGSDVPDFYSKGKHEFVPSDREPPEPKGYSSYFKNGEQMLNSNMWLTTKFGDLGKELFKEFYDYCKECEIENDNLYLEFRGDYMLTNAISMYKFFYNKHPELIFGTYYGDCFWNLFRASSSPDG